MWPIKSPIDLVTCICGYSLPCTYTYSSIWLRRTSPPEVNIRAFSCRSSGQWMGVKSAMTYLLRLCYTSLYTVDLLSPMCPMMSLFSFYTMTVITQPLSTQFWLFFSIEQQTSSYSHSSVLRRAVLGSV